MRVHDSAWGCMTVHYLAFQMRHWILSLTTHLPTMGIQRRRLAEGYRIFYLPYWLRSIIQTAPSAKGHPSCHLVILLFRSLNVSLDMSLVKSSLYNVIFLVVAFTSSVQLTAAQAVLCGQYQNLTSTSGQYMSKSKLCASNTTRHNLIRTHSPKRRLGCRRFRIAVHNGIIFPAQVLSKGISKVS